MWKKLKDWWTLYERLEAEVKRLEAHRETAISALKQIATGKNGNVLPATLADGALRCLGLRPWHITNDCPPDRVYFMPKGFGGQPTDYF